MPAPPPTITGTLKVQVPAFIRKLGRANHWGQPDDPLEQRIPSAVTQVFRNQGEPEISVFLVNNDEDLRRVAIGYNAGRKGALHETIAFLPILRSELEESGIRITKTPANLKCDHANQLHHDLLATNEQLETLCRNLIAANRTAAKCSESAMKSAAELARQEKCKSIPGVVECGLAPCKSLRTPMESDPDGAGNGPAEQADTALPPTTPPS
jgi:hypothetical protein